MFPKSEFRGPPCEKKRRCGMCQDRVMPDLSLGEPILSVPHTIERPPWGIHRAAILGARTEVSEGETSTCQLSVDSLRARNNRPSSRLSDHTSGQPRPQRAMYSASRASHAAMETTVVGVPARYDFLRVSTCFYVFSTFVYKLFYVCLNVLSLF